MLLVFRVIYFFLVERTGRERDLDLQQSVPCALALSHSAVLNPGTTALPTLAVLAGAAELGRLRGLHVAFAGEQVTLHSGIL